jgi:hypothetical protein
VNRFLRSRSPWLQRVPWVLMPPACRGCGTLLEPLAMAAVGFPYLCNPCHDALPWRPDPGAGDPVDDLDRVWAPWHYAELDLALQV